MRHLVLNIGLSSPFNKSVNTIIDFVPYYSRI